MKCPFCAEEIKDEAKKCRFCGEWLVGAPSNNENQGIVHAEEVLNSDESAGEKKCFLFQITYGRGFSKKYDYPKIIAINEEQARGLVQKRYPGWAINEEYGAKELPTTGLFGVSPVGVGNGKFSCPKCKGANTNCNREIGCAVMIIIFVSLGLGLIMIPFLPHSCECHSCGFKWKS